MRLFIVRDVLEVVVVSGRVTCIDEILLSEILESIVIEHVLKMLKLQIC